MQFNWLILSVPLNEAMAGPVSDSPLREVAHVAIRVFPAAYGARPGASGVTRPGREQQRPV